MAKKKGANMLTSAIFAFGVNKEVGEHLKPAMRANLEKKIPL
jgi:hypothetical protein